MANLVSMLDHMPVGYRFRPTDEELVDHYLKNKLLGDDFLVQIIPQIDMCNHEPSDLPALSVIKSDDPEWFFFSPLQFRYSNSTRLNRATERGFWKATGKDRKIKVRGTNDVIGTKKTLVFYEGRVPNGVKTNWVIHEYHAVTNPPGQGAFVLCRLMKKPDKKAEEITDEMVYDEGEPSSRMVSDYENPATVDRVQDVSALLAGNLESNFWTPNPEDEYDLPSIQLSPITFGQEPSLEYSPFLNSFITNDNITSHFPCETTEEEEMDEFVNSMLVDDDEGFIEERRNAFVNSNPSELLKTVYYGSSDTDAEVVSVRYGNILDTPIVCNKNAGSRESRVMKMVKSSHGPDLAGTAQMSSNHEAKREKKDHFFQDDFWEVDTSSGDSTAAKPLKINNIEISSFPSTLRTCKTQYQPRPDNSVLQRAGTRRSQTQRKVSTKSVSHHEAQKETCNVESNKSQRKAQGNTLRNTLEAPSNQSSDTNGRGSFVHLETPSMSQNVSPRSVYLVNVVIGVSLFVVIIWELLSCGRFY